MKKKHGRLGRMFTVLLALAGILVCAVLFLFGETAQVQGQGPSREKIEDQRVVIPGSHWWIGAYKVQVLRDYARSDHDIDPSTGKAIYDLLMAERLQILRNGILLDQVTDHRIDLFPEQTKNYTPPPLRANVIGTATPNLIAYGWSGGAHCCSTTHIYDLGDEFRKVAKIDTGDYDLRFKQLDDDPALEIEVIESIYQYWRAGPSDAVRPVVVLKLDAEKKRYAFSPVLMRRPPPAELELRAEADAVRALPAWTERRRPPPRLWEVMLDLIYAGNYPLARPFFDRAWNYGAAGKEKFWNELIKCQMRHSEFWPDVAALNGLAATKPEGECPGPQ